VLQEGRDEKVKAVLSGIRRTIGAAPVRKRAATSDMVIAMSATGTSLRALRDRAIILLGFAGAFRRSELVALDVEDLEEAPEGLLVAIRRSKTDQEGIGRKIAIPRGEIACPVAALRAWLEAAGITEGAVFRRVFNKRAQRVTDKRLAARNVATIVKTAAAKLGLEAAAFAGHSLRAGFVTSAVKRGANLIKITDVTGHRSLEMLKTYSRDAEAFVGHAGAGLYRRTEKNFSKATASTMPRGHRYSAWRSIFSRARFPTEHRGLKDDVQRMTVPTTPSTPRGGLSGFSLVAPHAPECPGAFVVCGRLQPQI
jgi:integrase